jgi:calcineurin-like phosphoesterase family protein
MNYFFISDTHFGHANIIRYTLRPFSSVQEMDKVLIENWNKRVKKDDTVFFLGDFLFMKSSEAPEGKKFEYFRSQLNGNIIFIRGNHDKNNQCKTIIQSLTIHYGGHDIFLTHNPQFARQDKEFNFVGHVHEKWKFKEIAHGAFAINLSVEQWDYKPVNINEIMSAFYHWKKHERKSA